MCCVCDQNQVDILTNIEHYTSAVQKTFKTRAKVSFNAKRENQLTQHAKRLIKLKVPSRKDLLYVCTNQCLDHVGTPLSYTDDCENYLKILELTLPLQAIPHTLSLLQEEKQNHLASSSRWCQNTCHSCQSSPTLSTHTHTQTLHIQCSQSDSGVYIPLHNTPRGQVQIIYYQ